MAEPARTLDPISNEPSAASGEHRIAQDRRRSSRVPISLPVIVETDGESFTGIASDIGLGGIFVKCGDVPAYGAEVNVRLELPLQGPEIRLPGIVRWVTRCGFGVQLAPLGARETHALVQFVRSR
jgi:hypothetical protein